VTLVCQADGCHSRDVTARMVNVDGRMTVVARVLLCDLHGRCRPLWERRSIPYTEPTWEKK